MHAGEFQFGPFRFDARQRLLFRDGRLVETPPKILDLLAVLLEENGRVVEKADILRRVWPDTHVEETGLARNVSQLRKTLGDDDERFIQTIPKRGYRFASLDPSLPLADRRLRFALPIALAAAALIYWQFYAPGRYLPGGPGYAAVAVVPFEILTPKLVQSGFDTSLAESLAAAIAALGPIHVTSPSTVRRYRNLHIPVALMTRLLRLDAVLEGSVEEDQGRLRVNARLSDIRSGKLIWADTLDQPAGDRLQAEKEIAAAIALPVAAHLSLR